MNLTNLSRKSLDLLTFVNSLVESAVLYATSAGLVTPSLNIRIFVSFPFTTWLAGNKTNLSDTYIIAEISSQFTKIVLYVLCIRYLSFI